MDDEKKKPKEMEIGLVIFFILVFLVVTWSATINYFNTTFPFLNISFLATYWPPIFAGLKTTLGVLVAISFPLSLFFLVGIIYCVERLKMIRTKEKTKYDLKIETAYDTVDKGDPNMSRRWDGIQKHIESQNPNDWRQAIIDADIILDDILNRLGYRGETIGEKLNRASTGDFQTLQDAWDAHKVRNEIAHEGSNASLNQLEAKRVISLYKKVFEEFYYI